MNKSLPLPMSRDEMQQRGWDEVDVVFVTGDAYVDHPSFAAALLGRVLEADGFRIGILSQPDWHSSAAWKTFGQPKLAFCVSAGNMDSMINHYTANRKVRNEDAYSPNGQIGLRPDRATLSYCQRAREAYPGCVVIAGGVEASLRRLAHYDYWSDKVKRSFVLDSKADLLVYGMGEQPLLEILRRLRDGEAVETIRNVRGTAYRLKKTEDLPEETETCLHLPSQEEVEEDKSRFSRMTRLIYENLNPYLGITLVQENGEEAVVVNPPSLPLDEAGMDRIYGLPFTRKPHPSYGKAKIPAFEVIRHSVQIHRGCFGGCSFCSLAAHQGKLIQSRSKESIVAEVKNIAEDTSKELHFTGTISDLGAPTANMYRLGCKNEAAKEACRRVSCLAPDICGNLETDQGETIKLVQAVRKIPNVEKVLIASGIRTDLALLDPRYVEELVRYHTGGHLKTAPEHTDPTVLRLMNKPEIENYDTFCDLFAEISRKSGKEQYLVPYLMAGFPGTTLKMAVETAVYLKRHRIRSEQVQEFIPGPFEWATSIYYTGMDPATGRPVYVPRRFRERRLQKALLLYDDPNSYHDIKSALIETGREDLIGDGPDCLIPKHVPKSMLMRRSSKVKRLQKQNARDKAAKTKRREDFEEARLEQERRKQAGRGSRKPFGRSARSDGSGPSRDNQKDSGHRKPFRDRPSGDRNRDAREDREGRSDRGEQRGEQRGERRPPRDRRRDGEGRDDQHKSSERKPFERKSFERGPKKDFRKSDQSGGSRPFRKGPPKRGK